MIVKVKWKGGEFGEISVIRPKCHFFRQRYNMEDEQELVCYLSNGAISNDLERS